MTRRCPVGFSTPTTAALLACTAAAGAVVPPLVLLGAGAALALLCVPALLAGALDVVPPALVAPLLGAALATSTQFFWNQSRSVVERYSEPRIVAQSLRS